MNFLPQFLHLHGATIFLFASAASLASLAAFF
jgi:hypothetical protein